jgi:hypothetical protein
VTSNVRLAACVSLLITLLTTASRAQDPPLAEVIADIDALVAEGKLPEARRRLDTTRGLAVPPELQTDLELAQTRLLVAAAAAYGRGEDCGFWTAEEVARISGGDQSRAKARELWNLVLDLMSRTPTLPFRTRALVDPALEPLRTTPGMRATLWASWRRPPREVWKDLELRTRRRLRRDLQPPCRRRGAAAGLLHGRRSRLDQGPPLSAARAG